MWYISFHGGTSGVNNIQVYHNSGKPHSNPDLLPTGGSNPPLCELRAFKIVGDHLYVVNGFKKLSQVIRYRSNGKGGYDSGDIIGSKGKVQGIFHPYDITFDNNGNIYISSQDTNVVTGLKAKNTPMDVAPYLVKNYQQKINFMPGTRVASSKGRLPNAPAPFPPDVPQPQGLDVGYTDDTKSKVAHSVRGILCHNGSIYVSDEPSNSVKAYNLESGEFLGEIAGPNLISPVQLLLQNDTLFIGSSGNDSVVTYDLSSGPPFGIVTPTTFIDGEVKHISGMAFDPDGNFYAAERKARKIKKFDGDGHKKGHTFIKDLPDNPEFIMYVPKS